MSFNLFKSYLPQLNVSRETVEKYEIYFDLLKLWNKTISLVQEKTLDDFFLRHVIDSLQIVDLIDNSNSSIVDIGTGAGFPGMALAIYGYKNIALVESNRKKTIFLNEARLKTKTSVKILNERAEELNDKYDFILSRACSSLSNLLSLMSNVSRETSVGIFHKGVTFLMEIEEAKLNWTFDYELKDSITDKNSKIIIVRNVGRKYG
ncbi:MAG: 16S rRNA (guanine(527)-N(7))-methyltransferase RsmG [Alphaproteobacteria bacterium]|nr:16S rRNA (guanine(527)-N(7))-methyltransferase RsmG [Alphaproteobacteria bacterium]